MQETYENQSQRPTSSITNRQLSWLADLIAYQSRYSPLDYEDALRRSKLRQELQEQPTSADAWLALLSHEEYIAKTSTQHGDKRGVGLFHLYYWATQAVSRARNGQKEEYLKLWLGYARHQWERDPENARDTFKTLKYQMIGDTNALLYTEWATLEAAAGNISKALSILQKGIRAHAQPVELLERMAADIQSGPLEMHTGNLTDTITMRSLAKQQLAGKDISIHDLVAAPAGRDAAGIGAAAKTAHTGGQVQEMHTSHSLQSNSSRSTSSTTRTGTGSFGGMGAKNNHTYHSSTDEDTISCQPTQKVETPRAGSHVNAVAVAGATATAGAGAAAAAPTAAGTAASSSKPPPQGGNSTTGLSGPRTFTRLRVFGLKGKAMRVGAHEATIGTSTGTAVEAAKPVDDGAASRKRSAEMGVPEPAASTNPAIIIEGAKRRFSPVQEKPLPDAKLSLPTAAASRQPAPQQVTPRDMEVDLLGRPASSACAASTVTPVDQLASRPSSIISTPASAGSDKVTPQGFPGFPRADGFSSDDGTPKLAAAAGDENIPPTIPVVPLLSMQPVAARPAAPEQPPLQRPAPIQQAPAPVVPRAAPAAPVVRQHAEAAPPAVSAARRQVEAAAAPVPAARQQAEPAPAPAARQQLDVPLRQPSAAAPVTAQPPAARASARAAADAAAMPPPRPKLPAPQDAARAAEQQRLAAMAAQQRGADTAAGAARLQQTRAKEDAHAVYVRGVRYTKLECVGRGGSSKVFKVMAPNSKIYALKRIRLQGQDTEAATGFIEEIKFLKQLHGRSNIIQLIDSQVFQAEGLIYMVLEYGDIDLARLLANHERARKQEGGGKEIDENFIRLYWQQMLQAVRDIHELRIVHSDLKPANFLLVEGQLKLIDFGIAKAMSGDTTSIARETQVGTLNYMSPEAILGGTTNYLGVAPMKFGRPSDIWALGCILYQMVYGKTPFAELPFYQKMQAIANPKHVVHFPQCPNEHAVDVMKRCLDRNPKTRITMQELLDHPFLHPNRHPSRQPSRSLPAPAISEDEIKRMLRAEIAQGGQAGEADLDRLAAKLLQRLATGQASLPAAAPAPPPPPPPAAAPAPPPLPPAKLPMGPPPARPLHAAAKENLPAAGGMASVIDSLRGKSRAELLRPTPQSSRPAAASAACDAKPDLSNLAQQAAAMAARRAQAGADAISALEQRRATAAAAGAAPSAAAPELQAALQGRLRQLGAGGGGGAAGAAAGGEGLEAALRQGLQKFRFDDDSTSGTVAEGELTAPHPLRDY